MDRRPGRPGGRRWARSRPAARQGREAGAHEGKDSRQTYGHDHARQLRHEPAGQGTDRDDGPDEHLEGATGLAGEPPDTIRIAEAID